MRKVRQFNTERKAKRKTAYLTSFTDCIEIDLWVLGLLTAGIRTVNIKITSFLFDTTLVPPVC